MNRERPDVSTGKPARKPAKKSATSSSPWPGFAGRLALALGRLAEDQFLVLSLRGAGRYVQFAGQGDSGMRAEASSNYYLQGKERLTKVEVQALRAAGWAMPSATTRKGNPKHDPSGSPNFYRDIDAPVDAEVLARWSVETLSDILGVLNPQQLEYDAFHADGKKLAFAELGLKRYVQESPLAVESAADPKEQLLETLRGVTGIVDLKRDDDGDVSVRFGGVLVCARVMGSSPLVRFFSPLVHSVRPSGTLSRKLNEINGGAHFVRCFARKGTVYAVMDLPALPYVDALVASAYRDFCRLADDLSVPLRVEFGERSLVTSGESRLLH